MLALDSEDDFVVRVEHTKVAGNKKFRGFGGSVRSFTDNLGLNYITCPTHESFKLLTILRSILSHSRGSTC
jgi:hypothetical protein